MLEDKIDVIRSRNEILSSELSKPEVLSNPQKLKKIAREHNELNQIIEFYDKLQEIQKQLLNSLYGVLGLSIFRFYDLDNAIATTLSGQAIIKFTEKMGNEFYSKIINADEDFIYEIELENGQIIKKNENDIATVIRHGKEIEILMKNVENTDDFLK